MNKILIGMLFALSASTAFAQSDNPANGDEKIKVEATAADRAAANDAADKFCLHQTGSHVHAIVKDSHEKSAVQCVNAPGRAYTRAELERTGALTTAEALRRLDPSVH